MCMDIAGLEKPWFCAQFLYNHVDMSKKTEAAPPNKVNATCPVAVVQQNEQSNCVTLHMGTAPVHKETAP